jgi:hypothetical protein
MNLNIPGCVRVLCQVFFVELRRLDFKPERTEEMFTVMLWIRDILVRIQIRISTTYLRIRSLFFSSVADKMPKKEIF